MQAHTAMLTAIAAVFLQAQGVAHACSDRLVVVSRSGRFHRAYAAIHPASIVVYAQSPRHTAKAIRDARLQADLKLAGHHVLVVDSDRALTEALESARIDFVLTDVDDADRIAAQSDKSPARPKVLPVLYEPTRDEARVVEARYMCRFTPDDRGDRYLLTIDEAMTIRLNERKRKAGT